MTLKFGGHVQLAHQVFMRSDDGHIGLCLLRQVSGRRAKVEAGSDGKAGVAVEAHANVFAVVVELPNLWDIRRIRHFAVLQRSERSLPTGLHEPKCQRVGANPSVRITVVW